MIEGHEHLMKNTQVNVAGHDQYFYGRGKLLLSGEYFVLDGAKALALPVKVGQSLSVEYKQTFSPTLRWQSFDVNGSKWFDAEFEFWHFDCVSSKHPGDDVLVLQKLLRQARKQNPHFLRDEFGVNVKTKLGFPLEWGLGSSSTLIYNIAQWAYISPFELMFNTHGGSGYDIACAQSDGPIVYQKSVDGPNWSLSNFNPTFKDNLYFVYLGRKQSSDDAVRYFKTKRPYPAELIMAVSHITEEMIYANTLQEFNFLIRSHEELVSKHLQFVTAKNLFFSDFEGEIKSLGAWGGDFALVTSQRTEEETKKYFLEKGHNICLRYRDLILEDSFAAQLQHRDHGIYGTIH